MVLIASINAFSSLTSKPITSASPPASTIEA
jgi:hypothetical protein